MSGEDSPLTIRHATEDDVALLARLNQQLIRDEGHRNSMTLSQLRERMEAWIAGEYSAIVAHRGNSVLGYALYREAREDVYLRQLYVRPDSRRQGVGRELVSRVADEASRSISRLRTEVLVGNRAALGFWHALGFEDYCLTLERNLSEQP